MGDAGEDHLVEIGENGFPWLADFRGR